MLLDKPLNDLKMDEELKKYITNLKRAATKRQKKQFASRLQNIGTGKRFLKTEEAP